MPDMVQRWFEAFSDPAGGFHERLDKTLAPIALPKRLLTQCRQIYVYAQAGMDMSAAFEWMVQNYRDPNGGWRFSDRDGHYDLYAHAFVILTCAALGREDMARKTLDFVQARFDFAGTAQNPYMHLLEACLAMAEISKDPIYRQTAERIVGLFETRFFDGRALHEQAGGGSVEAGHQSEWVWLLNWYEKICGRDCADRRAVLFDWVVRNGIDAQHGGLFNAQTADGKVIDDKKRIWPVCESIRAARLMGDAAMAARLEALLRTHYLTPGGFWNEVLNRDLSPAADYLPGTTVYHLYPVLGYARA